MVGATNFNGVVGQLNTLQPAISANTQAALQSAGSMVTPSTLQPLTTSSYQTPTGTTGTSGSSTQPSLQDFISEAQKLGQNSFQAQADILGQSNQQLVSDMSRGLYSQNIGAASGVGQTVAEQAIKDRTNQLAPYAQQTATQTALQALQYQQQDQQQAQTRQDQAFNMILSGQLDKSQFTPADWAKYGITDPNSIKTISQMDIANQMTAQGMDPNNVNDQNTFRVGLQNQAKNTMKQNIIASYAAANNGAIPSQDQINALLLLAGQGTGALTPEEEQQLTQQYNTTQLDQQTLAAQKMYQASHPSSSVAGTLCYEMGLISKKDFMYVIRWRQKQKNNVIATKAWAGYQKAFGGICRSSIGNNPMAKLINDFLFQPLLSESLYELSGKKRSVFNFIKYKVIWSISIITYILNKEWCENRIKFITGNSMVYNYYRNLVRKVESQRVAV